MGFARYIRSCAWELVFCWVASSALAFTLCSGFYATDPFLQYPYVIAGACLALSALLYAVAYNARTAVVGGVLLAVGVVAVVVASAALGPGETPLEDIEGNYTLLALAVIAPTVLVFLGSRTQVGAVVMLLAGVYACAVVEYLYWQDLVAALVVFLAAGIALVVQKGYRKTLANTSAGKVAFAPIAGSAIALGVAALLVGGCFFYLVVAPLDPPHQVVKLITEYRRADEIEVRGTGAVTSDQGGRDGNLANGDEVESDEQASDNPFDTMQSSIAEMLDDLTDQLGDDGSTTQLFPREYLALIVALLVLLVIVAAILLKKLQRRLRYNRLTKPGGEAAAKGLYLFFLGRFRKLKVPSPDTASLNEYVAASEGLFSRFESSREGEQPVFAQLTGCYIRMVYGGERLRDGELEMFEGYYRSFYRNACRYVGRLRYALNFFRL